MIDWKFDCGNHGYKKVSFQGLLHGYVTIGNLPGADEDFILDLTDAFTKQRKSQRKKQNEKYLF